MKTRACKRKRRGLAERISRIWSGRMTIARLCASSTPRYTSYAPSRIKRDF
jgi:hypothetical protein